MARTPSEHSMMTYWLLREKEAAKKRKQAMGDGKKWFRRARLAAQEGRPELAREAKLRALQAKEEHDTATHTLELIEMEKDVLRRQQAGMEIDRSGIERAEQIKRNFEAIGIDTTSAELASLAERADADIALARLRQNANADLDASDPTAGADTSSASEPPIDARASETPLDAGASDASPADDDDGLTASSTTIDPLDSADPPDRADARDEAIGSELSGASAKFSDADRVESRRDQQDKPSEDAESGQSASAAKPAKPPSEGGDSPFESIGPTKS